MCVRRSTSGSDQDDTRESAGELCCESRLAERVVQNKVPTRLRRSCVTASNRIQTMNRT